MEGDQRFWKDRQFIFGLVIGLAIVLIVTLAIFLVKSSTNRNINSVAGSEVSDNATISTVGPETDSITNPAINTFELKKNAEICREDGKPVVYLFTASWCPHCQWIKDTYNKVVQEYVQTGKIKAYHFDAETGDDLLTSVVETKMTASATAAYESFNPEGSIPTFVFGCKYFRVGNGYENEDNLANEEKEFRAVIEDLISTKNN